MRKNVVAAALALILAAVGGAVGSASAAHPTGNSLVPSPPGSGASVRFLGGGRMTDGMTVLTLNDDAKRIRILGVHLVKAQGMKLIGARVAGPHRPVYQFVEVRGFPGKYNRKSVPAIGAVITPAARGWGMLIGLRLKQGPPADMQGVRITYRTVGHHRVKQQTLYLELYVCTRKSDLNGNGSCDPPAGSS